MNTRRILMLVLLTMCIVGFTTSTVFASTLTVHARTQDTDGVGIVILKYPHSKTEYTINPGETKTYNINGVTEIKFHSYNRHSLYDAYLDNVDKFIAKTNGANLEADVNFYKKSCYYDKFWMNGGKWKRHTVYNGQYVPGTIQYEWCPEYQEFYGVYYDDGDLAGWVDS